MDEMSPVDLDSGRGVPREFMRGALPTSEYKVGHHKPPLVLMILYVLVVVWAAISWIPFYGY